jgi:hypothetical protein
MPRARRKRIPIGCALLWTEDELGKMTIKELRSLITRYKILRGFANYKKAELVAGIVNSEFYKKQLGYPPLAEMKGDELKQAELLVDQIREETGFKHRSRARDPPVTKEKKTLLETPAEPLLGEFETKVKPGSVSSSRVIKTPDGRYTIKLYCDEKKVVSRAKREKAIRDEMSADVAKKMDPLKQSIAEISLAVQEVLDILSNARG